MGGGSKTTTVVQPSEPSYHELLLLQRNLELADKQLLAFEENQEFQRTLMDAFLPFIDVQSELMGIEADLARAQAEVYGGEGGIDLYKEELARSRRMGEISEELANLQLEEIKRRGAATDEQKALIAEATGAALEAGTSDIARFRDQSIEQLRSELAPSLGLRPGDTPIVDRGGEITEEAVRQAGQLTSNLRSAQANAELNFPLNAGQTFGALNQSQQSIGNAAAQFQQQLQNQAFQNRMSLMSGISGGAGQAANYGLGLVNASRPIWPGFQRGSTTTQTTSSGMGFGQILGGVGGLLSGIGALSSRKLKDRVAAVNGEEILAQLRRLPVERWRYKGSGMTHIGPYAEDFNGAFEFDDKGIINLLDLAGTLLAGLQTLAAKVEQLEASA